MLPGRMKTKEEEKILKAYLILSIIILSISCTNHTQEVEIDRTAEIPLIKEAINGAIGWQKIRKE